MTVSRNKRKQDHSCRNQKMVKGFATLHRKALGINNLCYLENHFDGTLARLAKQAHLAKRGKSTVSCAVPITIMFSPKGRKDRRASCRIRFQRPFQSVTE